MNKWTQAVRLLKISQLSQPGSALIQASVVQLYANLPYSGVLFRRFTGLYQHAMLPDNEFLGFFLSFLRFTLIFFGKKVPDDVIIT